MEGFNDDKVMYRGMMIDRALVNRLEHGYKEDEPVIAEEVRLVNGDTAVLKHVTEYGKAVVANVEEIGNVHLTDSDSPVKVTVSWYNRSQVNLCMVDRHNAVYDLSPSLYSDAVPRVIFRKTFEFASLNHQKQFLKDNEHSAGKSATIVALIKKIKNSPNQVMRWVYNVDHVILVADLLNHKSCYDYVSDMI